LAKVFPTAQAETIGTSPLTVACTITDLHIQQALGRISFTTDIWSDNNRRPYLAITAHWIGKVHGTDSLELKVALIAFHRLRGRHDGKSLARTVLQLLDRAGITVKVSAECDRQGTF
jgi:hypothetical protein